jgi:septum formation protein
LPARGAEVDLRCAVTEVKFARMTPQELEAYVDTGEWSGVAGAYRIQERGGFFVEWIRGSYSNVVGLPLETFYGILKHNKYPLA